MKTSLANSSIAWVLPAIVPGSGGLQTIFRHIMHLQELGARSEVFVMQPPYEKTAGELAAIAEGYGCENVTFHPFPQIEGGFDVAIATMSPTARYVEQSDCAHKCYFVQDFEPWFYPAGEEQINAIASYKLGLEPITIGNWLASRLHEEFSSDARVTPFCADASIYHRLGTDAARGAARRERAVCMIYQPGKPRRCAGIILDTVRIINRMDPSVRVYLYGSQSLAPQDVTATNLGLLTKEQCNELYNRCSVGISISGSNPSRVPFEMMAAGLPVIDVYEQNNLYDYPDSCMLLAEPTPEALATAALSLLDDAKAASSMSTRASEAMAKLPIELETTAFAEALEDIVLGGDARKATPARLYNRAAVTASDEARAVFHDLCAASIEAQYKAPVVEGPLVRLSIELPDDLSGVESPHALVWHAADQSDMRDFPLHHTGERLIQGVLDLEGYYGAQLGRYQIHAYGVVNGREQLFAHCERGMGSRRPEPGPTGDAVHEAPEARPIAVDLPIRVEDALDVRPDELMVPRKSEIEMIRESSSFRIGRAITSLPRKARDLFRR